MYLYTGSWRSNNVTETRNGSTYNYEYIVRHGQFENTTDVPYTKNQDSGHMGNRSGSSYYTYRTTANQGPAGWSFKSPKCRTIYSKNHTCIRYAH